MNNYAYTVFVVLWIATFFPAWKILLKLLALSISKKPARAKFTLLFILYRLIILLPYIALLALGQKLPGLLINLVVSVIILSFIFSVIRLFLRDQATTALWNIYSYVYDGLLKFYPYRQLLHLVVDRVPKTGEVLDAGCGTGNLSYKLAHNNQQLSVVAIDASRRMVKQAGKKLGGLDNVRVQQADIAAYLHQHPQQKFDAIVMVNVLYALDERSGFWQLCLDHLKPSGRLVVTNSDKGGSWPIIKEHLHNDNFLKLLTPKLLGVFVIDVFISQLASAGKFNFLSYEELQKEIGQAGGVISQPVRCYGGQKDGVNLLFTVTSKA